MNVDTVEHFESRRHAGVVGAFPEFSAEFFVFTPRITVEKRVGAIHRQGFRPRIGAPNLMIEGILQI
jgi:hypothetical protein